MPTLRLDVPSDLHSYILQVQGNIKSQKGIGKYSQQRVILTIIKEHKEFKEKKQNENNS